jgi:hypothetical protein
MSLLADFLLAINDNWVTMLQPASLRGKEQEVLDLFLLQRKKGAVDKTLVQQELGLSNHTLIKSVRCCSTNAINALRPMGV